MSTAIELPVQLKFKAQQFLQKFSRFSHLHWDGSEVTVYDVGDNDHACGLNCFEFGSPTYLAIESLENEFFDAEISSECDIRI